MSTKTKTKSVQKPLAILRIRGRPGFPFYVQDTLKMLRLHKPQHVVIYEDSPSLRGMLQKAKDLITWGEIDLETLVLLLTKRGRLRGDQRLTDSYIRKHTSFRNIKSFAKAVIEGKAKLNDVPDLKPVFRLHPPRRGYKDVKHHVNEGGDLGYRGEDINRLLQAMI